MSHDWLFVFADEDAVWGRTVEAVEGGKDLADLVHEVRPEHVVLLLTITILRLRLEAAQLTGQVSSGSFVIFRQQIFVVGHPEHFFNKNFWNLT